MARTSRFSPRLLRRYCAGFLLLVIAFLTSLLLADGGGPQLQPPDSPRPIAARESVFLEELTWMELRDAVAAGKTVAIVPTGGIEQSGPYLPLGKHNYVLSRTMELLARDLGNALVAPTLAYVPEGDISPPTIHMMYPGTVSLREDLFVAVLEEIGKSLASSGFRTIVLLGDSGDNQHGLETAARHLNELWFGTKTRAIFLKDYYDYPEIAKWLETQGYLQVPEGIHDDLAFSSELLAIDESLVRYAERTAAGKLSINGVSLADKEKIAALGNELLKRRAERSAARLRELLKDEQAREPKAPEHRPAPENPKLSAGPEVPAK